MTTWIELEGIMLRENESEGEQIPDGVNYMWNINKQNKRSDNQ